MPYALKRRHFRGFRGLGQTCVDAEAGTVIDCSAASAIPLGTPAPSSSGGLTTAIESTLPTIVSQGFKTLQLALTPSGSYLIQQPGGGYVIANQVPGAVPGALNVGTSVAGNFNIGSVLLWGGLIVGVIFVAKAIGGK